VVNNPSTYINDAFIYPILKDFRSAQKLMDIGLRFMQIRIKFKSQASTLSLLNEINYYARKTGTQLVINDFLEFALELKGCGVHLGQEDLLRYNPVMLKNRNFILGISTHSFREIQTALSYHPDYISFGPIFHTETKPLKTPPHGVEVLKKIGRPIPLFAIGGISLDNASKVFETGVTGVALISALENQDCLNKTVKKFKMMKEKSYEN